jgi:hypothetical protein
MGGTGTERLAMWGFGPSVPNAASEIRVEVDGDIRYSGPPEAQGKPEPPIRIVPVDVPR